MYEVGRIVVKIAGRDAGKSSAVVDVIDEQYVLIDGQTRRRKVSIAHIEPTDKVVKLKKGASNKEVVAALNKEGIECKEKTEKKEKAKSEKPKKTSRKSAKKADDKKATKKPSKEKKAEKK